jgi:hypothetical protein
MSAATTLNKNLENEVLFQKLGSTWFIFTEIKGDVVYSQLPDGMDPYNTKLELYEVIEEHMLRVSENYRTPEKVA